MIVLDSRWWFHFSYVHSPEKSSNYFDEHIVQTGGACATYIYIYHTYLIYLINVYLYLYHALGWWFGFLGSSHERDLLTLGVPLD